MKKPSLPKLTDAELKIMDIVWNQGETTINYVWKMINQRRKNRLSRTTIQVQMNRLEEKKWLTHRVKGRTFCYRATSKREIMQKGTIRDLHAHLFSGSCEDLVRCLFESVELTQEDIQKLRQLIKKHEGETK